MLTKRKKLCYSWDSSISFRTNCIPARFTNDYTETTRVFSFYMLQRVTVRDQILLIWHNMWVFSGLSKEQKILWLGALFFAWPGRTTKLRCVPFSSFRFKLHFYNRRDFSWVVPVRKYAIVEFVILLLFLFLHATQLGVILGLHYPRMRTIAERYGVSSLYLRICMNFIMACVYIAFATTVTWNQGCAFSVRLRCKDLLKDVSVQMAGFYTILPLH